jgi:excisionase family DNA binding protein
MNAKQAARYVGVHYQTFLAWVGNEEMNVPKIPVSGKGHDFRFMREMLDEWGWNRAINAPPRPGKKPPVK